MGYRHYFYKVKKADVDKIKGLNVTELKAKFGDEDEDVSMFNAEMLPRAEVFEFGKLYWDNTADRIYKKGVPLFDNEETQNYFDDYVPYIVGKEGLREAIKIYHENVVECYKSLLGDGRTIRYILGIIIKKAKINEYKKMEKFINDRLFWVERFFEDTDENNPYQVSASYCYEHSIFNLVHLLKTIDWGNETILFYGW